MASEGSKCEDGSETDVTTWNGWVAWHPEFGFAEGLGADGGGMLHIYDELDRELLDDIKELNEDDHTQGWKAVKVQTIMKDWHVSGNAVFGGPHGK